MTQTCKPKIAGVLLTIVGAGIPVLVLLVMILVFLRGNIDPLTDEINEEEDHTQHPHVLISLKNDKKILVTTCLLILYFEGSHR